MRHLLPALALALTATHLAAQVPGVSREQMWSAPTAEDWKKPCLLTFQRTWDDALAVSRESGRPILVCVNMDGEIASEHYAGVRYRQPDMAALYDPYVCVIASVYRHTPRDYDEQGARIPCPRFGSVTCGEHIAIEPLLFDQYFDDKRIAPRHVMVELDRQEVFDVYYAFDTQSVFKTIEQGVAGREFTPRGGDRPLLERVTSRDVADRTAVEQAYRQGNRELRRSILERLVITQDLDQVDLLRLALFGFDTDLARLARQSLAQMHSEKAIDLINEALRVPMESAEREALIDALARLGETWPRAATLAAVQRGLAEDSGLVDVAGWSSSLAGTQTPAEARDWYALEARLAEESEASVAAAHTPDEQLELAEGFLALAVDPGSSVVLAGDARTAERWSQLLFEDARNGADRAEAAGAAGWRLDAVQSIAAWYLGDYETAYERAGRAMAELPEGAPGHNAMSVVAIFAEGRRRAIWKAAREGQEWPRQWLTDVHAAYSVLAVHPLGNDLQVVAHHDFLRSMGAPQQAATALAEGLARFPDSAFLHDRLRASILAEQGVEALEPAYEALLAREDASTSLPWFAGYTSLVVAEYQRRAGDDTAALAAYARSIEHFERAIELQPAGRDSADHYVALVLAGRARLALERGDEATAVAELIASFERRPMSAASLDGLGLSAVATGQMLRSRLEAGQRADLLVRLDSALAALDPEVFIPPTFETFGRNGRRRGQ